MVAVVVQAIADGTLGLEVRRRRTSCRLDDGEASVVVGVAVNATPIDDLLVKRGRCW
jgi:hypothetical protein